MNNWHFATSKSSDKQLLYSFDRPTYSFKVREEKKSNKTVLIPSKNAIWNPINIEMPTRILSWADDWFKNKYALDIVSSLIDRDGRVLEEWDLRGVEILNYNVKRGRMIDIVLSAVIKPSWARKTK